MVRSRKALLIPTLLVAALLPLGQATAAKPAATAAEPAATAAPAELTTHAGGSALVLADGPARARERVEVRVRRTDGAPLAAADVRIALGTNPVTAAYDNLDVTASGGALVASARVTVPDGVGLAVRPTFYVRGDYRVDVLVGGQPVSSADVLVASAFERVGYVQVGTEIVSATPDGNTLVTTAGNSVGIVDITDPAAPGPVVTVPVADGVTSVDVTPDGRFAVVATTSSVLGVVDIASATTVRRIPIPAGADSVKVSPDGRYGLVAVDAAAGGEAAVLAVDIVGEPAEWTTRRVPFDKTDPVFDGAANLAPEGIDVDENNHAALAFQGQAAVAVVDLATGDTINLFDLGTSTRAYDAAGGDGGTFTPGPVRTSGPREPDGVSMTGGYVMTPNEGGGARSWSVFEKNGTFVYDSGAELEQRSSFQGFYRESDPEFEQVETATFGSGADLEPFALVGSERWGSISAYRIDNVRTPRLTQIFGSNVEDDDPRPEGIVAVPARDLVIVANEDEDSVVIFRRVAERRATDELTLTSHLAGTKEITGWAAAGPDSLVGIALGRRLFRASVTPTEVVVDGAVPITGADSPLATTSTSSVAVEPSTGDVWIPLTVSRATQGDPVEDRIAKVDDAGRVTESVDISPGVLDTDSRIRAITATAGTLWAVTESRSTNAQRIVRYDLADGTAQSWPIPFSEVIDLTVLAGGDLGIVHTIRLDDVPSHLQDRTILDRVRVAGVQPGDQAIVSRVSDLTGDHGFHGTDGNIGEGATLLNGTDMLVVAPVPQGGRTPLQRIDDVVPAVGAAQVSGVLGATTAEAGASVVVTATSDRVAGAQVQARYAGGGYSRLAARPDLGWHPLPLDTAVALADGDTEITVPAPALDGQWELRLATLSADGKTRYAAIPGRLTVTTPAVAPTVVAPTTAAPASTYAAGPFPVRVTVPDAGVVAVETRAAGSSTWQKLTVPNQGIVAAAGTSTVMPAAPSRDSTYDLRVSFYGGGSGTAQRVEVAGALRVVTPPRATVTVTPTDAAPATTWAGGQFPLTVTTDVLASVTVRLVPRDGGTAITQIPGLSGASFTGARTANVRAPLADGTYDVEVAATNPSGTTTVTEPGAVVITTPDPTATVLAPTLPHTITAAAPFTLQVRFNQSGTWTVDTRPSGTTAWTRDPGFLAPRVIQPTATTTSVTPTAPRIDGNYDLRIGFTNEVGEYLERVFTPGIVVNTPDPAVQVVAPTAEAPATTTAAGRFDVQLTTDQVVTAEVALRPAGNASAPWTAAGSFPVDGTSGDPQTVSATTPFIASGSYDVRARVTNAVGGTNEHVVPGAVTVANPLARPVIEEPMETTPLKRRPESSVQNLFQGVGVYDYSFEIAPAGTEGWQVVETGRTNFQGFRYGPVPVPATPGAYDLRVVATNPDGIVDIGVARNALYVGRGPASPVVINEWASGSFTELRNITDQPVDISGYRMVACRQEENPGYRFPAGTVLDPNELLLTNFGGGNGGIELRNAQDHIVEAVGAETGQGCWEGATLPPIGSSASWSRDADGTDTDDNGNDFTPGPATPGQL